MHQAIEGQFISYSSIPVIMPPLFQVDARKSDPPGWNRLPNAHGNGL